MGRIDIRFRVGRCGRNVQCRSGIMEVAERKCSGYGKPPWIFKGSALYQLHLVKAETAQAFIPKEFRLVEAFGYTLGGFFLASYDESPVGSFDELVVIAGIVWNPPTSCAWAARVLVSSDDACDHGRKDVGLPSQVARFSKRITAISRQPMTKSRGFLNVFGWSTPLPKAGMDVQVTEMNGPLATDVFNINLVDVDHGQKIDKWMGPAIKMSLPSFSGHTEYNPNLLKYSCNIKCCVQTVSPARVSMPTTVLMNDNGRQQVNCYDEANDSIRRELSISVMLSKPILALRFNCLTMQVEAPEIVADSSTSVKSS